MPKMLLAAVALFLAVSGMTIRAVAQPKITSFTPPSGPVGTPVTITGSNFNASAPANIVYFGAVRAAVTGGSAGSLTVTAPAGATYKPVSVLNTATGLAGFSGRPFKITFPDPSGNGVQADFYKQRISLPTQTAEFVMPADFDGDGRPDLVTAGRGLTTVSIHRNVSDKGSLSATSFAAPAVLAAGTSSIYSMDIIDVDGDGKPDIVLPSFVSHEISILRNTSAPGNISFAAFTRFSLDAGPRIIELNDMDGDGRPDIVMCDYEGITVLRNLSTPGNITPASFGPRIKLGNLSGGVTYIALGDVDGDGACDIVATSGSDNMVAVLRNVATPGSLGASSFAAPVQFPAVGSAYNTLVGDIDGDNKPDVVVVSKYFQVGNDGYDTVSVYRNVSSPGSIALSARADFALDTLVAGAALGDVDGDGKPDLVIVHQTVNFLSILRNTAVQGSITPSSLALPVHITTPFEYLSYAAVGDLDGDGVAELTTSYYGSGTLTIFKATAAAPLPPKPVVNSFTPSSGGVGTTVTISGANFNATPGGSTVFFGAVKATVTAATTTALTVTVPAGATYQPVSVLNNATGLTGYAGKPFAVTFANPFGSGIPVNFYQPRTDFRTDNGLNPLQLSDIDGDGKADVVGMYYSYVSVLRNLSVAGSATAAFAVEVKFPITGNIISSLSSLAVSDLDGDGKPDIVVTALGENKVYVLRNTSTTGSITAASFAPPVEVSSAVFPRSAVIGDVDGDGKPEIIFSNQMGGTISILTNSSVPGTITASSFADKFDYPVGSAPVFLALRDLDGDSKPDLVVANVVSKTISLLRNTSTPGNLPPSFAAAVNIPVNNSIGYLDVADLDGDSKPDIIMDEYGGSPTGISVLRNTAQTGIINGSSFAAAVLVAPLTALEFVIGDADGDGRPDIIASNSLNNFFSVFRNVSTPGSISASSFAPKVDFPASGNTPSALALGDVDGDGLPEVEASNAAFVSIFKITTSIPPSISSFSPDKGPVGTTVTIVGSFFNANPSANTVYFGAVRATVTAGSATSLTMVVPAGATYQPISVLNSSNGLTAYSSKPFTVTFPNPAGTGIPAGFYGPRTDYSTGLLPYAVAIGDLDGDGKSDMVSVNANANTVSVLRNLSAGTPGGATSFAPAVSFSTGTDPRAVVISDVDGDGKPDLIVLNSFSGSVSVLRNTSVAGTVSASSFAAKVDFTVGSVTFPYSVAVGDLNRDGRPDLVVANLLTSSVGILRNTATPGSVTPASFGARVGYSAGVYPRFIVVNDLDGDGAPDLAVANERSNTVSVLQNTSVTGGEITFGNNVDFSIGTNPPCLAAGDVDGDGKPDLITANYGSNTVSVLRNLSVAGTITAASFAGRIDFATGINPFCVAVGDADGDGKPDLVTANANSNTISVLRNTAAGGINASSFAAKMDFAATGYPIFVAMGDLNGDGIPEVAAANAGANTLSVFRVNTALPAAGAPVIVPAGLALQVYPNPSAGEVTLQLANLKAPAVTIEVFSDAGRRVERRVVDMPEGMTEATVSLSLRNQPAGTYYIKATGVNGVQVVKVMVQHRGR